MISHLKIDKLGSFGELIWKEHGKINIIIGENDTGKTHLLKLLYSLLKSIEDFTKRTKTDKPGLSEVLSEKLFWVYQPEGNKLGELVKKGENRLTVEARVCNENYYFSFGKDTTRKIIDCTGLVKQENLNALFIPPKEVLTAFDAITAIKDELQIFGFDDTYQDLIKALRVPTSKGKIQKDLRGVLDSLEQLFSGEIIREENRFILKRGREKYWMSQVAEGIKKIGILTTLIRNRTIRQNTVLFFDEPETNLHPNAIIAFVNMLFGLSQAGVQIYLSTHSYFVIKQFEILARKYKTNIQICSLEKQNKSVSAKFSNLCNGLPDNPIIDASIKLYEEDIKMELES